MGGFSINSVPHSWKGISWASKLLNIHGLVTVTLRKHYPGSFDAWLQSEESRGTSWALQNEFLMAETVLMKSTSAMVISCYCLMFEACFFESTIALKGWSLKRDVQWSCPVESRVFQLHIVLLSQRNNSVLNVFSWEELFVGRKWVKPTVYKVGPYLPIISRITEYNSTLVGVK